MTGMFRYMADAARFRECRSGIEWPVATSDEYRTLEHAYTERRTAPGAELLVAIVGRIEERPRMEGGGREPTLVVERLVRTMPGYAWAGLDPMMAQALPVEVQKCNHGTRQRHGDGGGRRFQKWKCTE